MKARPPRLPLESELVSGLQRAEREAFETLYETYFPRVYSYLRRRQGTIPEAERATEAALTEIVDAIVRGESQLPLERWVLSRVRAVQAQGLKSRSLAKVVLAATHPRSARS